MLFTFLLISIVSNSYIWRMKSASQHTFLFLGILIVFSGILGQWSQMQSGPSSIHMWRQTFGLSFATNYMQEDRGLCSPALHWEDSEGYRESASEFPLYYYIIGNLWKLTGKSHLLYRSISLFLLLAASCCLFWMIRKLTASIWISYGASILYFLSPVMVVYGNQFVIDAPIVNAAVIGVFLLFLYHEKGSTVAWLTGYIVLMVCGMSKPTVLMPLIALLLSYYPRFSKKDFWLHGIGIALVLSGTLGWILYVQAYNDAHSGLLFLRSTTPIWTLSAEKIMEIVPMFLKNVLPYLLPLPGLLILAVIFVSSLFFTIEARYVTLRRTLILGWLGALLYIALFFQIMDVHDYYMLELTWLIPLTLVHAYISVKYFIENSSAGFVGFRAFMLIAVLIMTLRSTAYYRLRHNPADPSLTQVEDWVTRDEIDFYRWVQYHYEQNYQPLLELVPMLDTLGITMQSRVAVVPDPSPCTALYLLNRYGYSGYHYSPEFIAGLSYPEYFRNRGADYFVLHDRNLFSDARYVPVAAKLIYDAPGVRVYDIRSDK